MKFSFLLGALFFETALFVGVVACATGTEPGLGMDGGSSGKAGSGGGNKGGASGNSNVGGNGTGGSSTGGSETGGSATGGSATGGSSTGGTNTGGTSTGGTSTGGTSTGGSSTGGTSTGGTSTGGTGGASGCQMTTGDATCDGCIGGKCETECIKCQDNTECVALLDCLNACPSGNATCQSSCQSAHSGGVADLTAFLGATSGCVSNLCDAECNGGGGTGGSGGGTYTLPAGCYNDGPAVCNPLTNEGCAADEACDLGLSGMECFPPPNDAGLGQTCDNSDPGPFCAATLHCSMDSYKCRKICCDDSDCSGSDQCNALDLSVGSFGICE